MLLTMFMVHDSERAEQLKGKGKKWLSENDSYI